MKENSQRASHRKISEGGKYSIRNNLGIILQTAKHWNDARKLWLAASAPCKVFNGDRELTGFQP